MRSPLSRSLSSGNPGSVQICITGTKKQEDVTPPETSGVFQRQWGLSLAGEGADLVAPLAPSPRAPYTWTCPRPLEPPSPPTTALPHTPAQALSPDLPALVPTPTHPSLHSEGIHSTRSSRGTTHRSRSLSLGVSCRAVVGEPVLCPLVRQ